MATENDMDSVALKAQLQTEIARRVFAEQMLGEVRSERDWLRQVLAEAVAAGRGAAAPGGWRGGRPELPAPPVDPGAEDAGSAAAMPLSPPSAGETLRNVSMRIKPSQTEAPPPSQNMLLHTQQALRQAHEDRLRQIEMLFNEAQVEMAQTAAQPQQPPQPLQPQQIQEEVQA